MSKLISSDKAMSGIWRAFVIDKVTNDTTGKVYVYIPQLHRKNFPFDQTGDTLAVKADVKLQQYPVANGSAWAVRSDLKTGDAVWLIFENGDSNYPIIVGQLASALPTYDDLAAQYISITGASGGEFVLSNLGQPVEVLTPPSGYGTAYTYEAWNRKEQGFKYDWTKGSQQYKLYYNYSHTFDANGFGKLGNRYVIAMTSNKFKVGDVVDVEMSNGRIIQAIIGDTKNPGDAGANYWGHNNGKCMVEWMTNWKKGHANPPSDGSVVKILKYGSFFDHPEWATAAPSATTASVVPFTGPLPASSPSTSQQQSVINVATHSSKYGISTASGYCQRWVSDVYYKALGGSRLSKESAAEAARAWAVSTDFSKIQPGATVYGLSSNNSNGYKNKYGHVGIYVGNNTVYHNVGKVKSQDLSSWISTYKGKCWGWNGVVLNTAYPFSANVGKSAMVWPS